MFGCLKINPQSRKTIRLDEKILLYSCYPLKKMQDKQHLCFWIKVCEWLFSICTTLFGSLLALHAHQVKTFALPLPVQLGRLLRSSPKWGQSATELVPSDLRRSLPNHRQPMMNLLLSSSNKSACRCTQLMSVQDMRKSLFVQLSVLVCA